MASEKIALYYWPARGRGEQIRLVLAEAGVTWEEPTFDMSDEAAKLAYFAKCRELGGNLTTNVPMLEIDGMCLTQSSAVLKYAARKYGIYPQELSAAYFVDNLIAAAEDLRTANYKPMPLFGATEEAKVAYTEKVLPNHLENLAQLLGGASYFAQDAFSVADLTIYDTLDVANRQVPGVLDKYPTLKAFHARVEERPNIATYLSSERRGKLFAFPAL